VWSFRTYLFLRKASKHAADLSVFRQTHTGCTSPLAYKIQRFCLVPLSG
jgi:hypothetical protein